MVAGGGHDDRRRRRARGIGPGRARRARRAGGCPPLESFRLPAEDEARSDEVRRLVRAATEATRPKLVLHGHWHRRNSYELAWPVEQDGQLAWRSVQVEGLAADVQGDFQASGLLELDPLRFSGGETYRADHL